jgi:hypothetical protein
MRRSLDIFAVGALCLAFAGTAEAEVMAWMGTLDLKLETLDPVRATTDHQYGIILNSSAGGEHLNTFTIYNPGAIQGGEMVLLTDPDLALLVSLRGDVVLGSGVIGQISGGAISGGPLFPNTLPVGGVFRMCILFPGCGSYIPVPLTVNGTRGVGIGGVITVNGYATAGIKVTATYAPWTIKTAVAIGLTANGGFSTISQRGFAHGPASATSSTANVDGVVQLVTPVQVVSNVSGTLPLFGIVRIHFVPEPGSFLLLATGVVALLVGGRGRAKR